MSFWSRLKSLPSSWLVSGLIILTLVLRLPLLNGSFWLDEAAQILESMRPWSQQLQIRDDFQPPLLHVLTFFTRQISISEGWLRLWGALIPSLVVTWAMAKLLEEWWPKTTTAYREKTVWLGLLLATNSLWVFYSQELRPYSLAVMWTVLSWWAIVGLTKQPTNLFAPNPSKTNAQIWVGWTLSVLGGLYSTYLFPFVLISQGLYLLWQATIRPKLWKGLIFSSLAIVGGFAIWLPSFLGQLQAGQQLRTDLPGWDQIVSLSQFKSLPLAMGKFLFGVVDLELNFYYLGLAFLIIGLFTWLGICLWRQLRTHRTDLASKNLQSALLLFTWWIVVPVILAWVVSFKIPVIQPKRILFVLPAFYALAVLIATQVRLAWRNIQFGRLALFSLLIINVWSLLEYYRQPVYQRENWRDLHAQLEKLCPPDQTLAVFAFPAPFAAWQWYDQITPSQHSYPNLGLGYLTQPEKVDITNQLKTANDRYTYILVFEYLEPLTDPHLAVKAALHSLGWREIHAVSQPGVGFVRIYAKPSTLVGLKFDKLQ